MNRITVLLIIILLSSCRTIKVKWSAPPFTSVEKILNLKSGMTLEEVNQTLAIPPYNVFNIQSDGSMVLLYNYRLKNRKMEVPLESEAQENVKSSETGQNSGQSYYQNNSNYLYVYFKNNKLTSVVSEAGLEQSEYLLLLNNNISLLSKEEFDKLQMKKLGSHYIVNSNDTCNSIIINTNSYLNHISKKPYEETRIFTH